MESRETQHLCSGKIEKQFERFKSRSRKRRRKAVVSANVFPTRKPPLMQTFSLEAGTGARKTGRGIYGVTVYVAEAAGGPQDLSPLAFRQHC